jgi:primary-amine oxidase
MFSRWKWLTTGVLFLAGMMVGASWPWASAQQAGEQRVEAGQAEAPVAKRPVAVAAAAKNWTEERLKIVKQPDDKTYEITINFPSDDHPQRTSWRILAAIDRAGTRSTDRENLVIRQAFFKKSPEADEIQVLGQVHLTETLVAYSKGTRYYDLSDVSGGMLPANDAELGRNGFAITPNRKMVAELKDRGIHWKAGHGGYFSRRGEELILWGTIAAANYLYLVEFGFRDEGTVTARMGSSGSNLVPGREIGHAHMHVASWRVDVNLGGEKNNDVYLVRHREPFGRADHSTQSVEPFNGGIEGFVDWDPKEFTTLRFTNPKIVNSSDNPVSYDLIAPRTGNVRLFNGPPNGYDETFTQHDFYVLKNNGDKENDLTKLPQYARQNRSIKNQDVVLWAITSAHHIPRDEDLIGTKGKRGTGATSVVWSGFELKPRDLFDSTPFYDRPNRNGKK